MKKPTEKYCLALALLMLSLSYVYTWLHQTAFAVMSLLIAALGWRVSYAKAIRRERDSEHAQTAWEQQLRDRAR